jgi:hypothetical protein
MMGLSMQCHRHVAMRRLGTMKSVNFKTAVVATTVLCAALLAACSGKTQTPIVHSVAVGLDAGASATSTVSDFSVPSASTVHFNPGPLEQVQDLTY